MNVVWAAEGAIKRIKQAGCSNVPDKQYRARVRKKKRRDEGRKQEGILGNNVYVRMSSE